MEPFIIFLILLLIFVFVLIFSQNSRRKKKIERRILKAEKKIDEAVDLKDTHSLMSRLNDLDTEIPFEIQIEHRKKIVDGFRRIGLPATEALIEILQDVNSRERIVAASILGEIGDRRVVEPLIEIVQDTMASDQPNLRETAVVALGELGDAKAVAPLFEVAENDSDANRRVIAGIALEKLGDPRAFDLLMNLLQIDNEHLDWLARANGLNALGKMRDARAVPLLVDHLAIAKLGAEEFKDEVRLAAANVLAEMGEPALNTLLDVINDPQSESRHYACYALGWMGDVRALPGLEKLMQEKKIGKSIRGAAGWAIDIIKKNDKQG